MKKLWFALAGVLLIGVLKSHDPEITHQPAIDTPVQEQTAALPEVLDSPSAREGRVFGEVVRFVAKEVCEDGCRLESVALHEYESYTIEELKVIAGYDGEAAIVLADKLADGDWKEAKNWALRAFVMTKDPYAYDMALNYSRVMPGEGFVNGEFDRKAAKQAYVWLRTAYLLGISNGAELTEQEVILDRHGVKDRERLDEEAVRAVAYLNKKRLEIVGRAF